jgi:hypothetical protein
VASDLAVGPFTPANQNQIPFFRYCRQPLQFSVNFAPELDLPPQPCAIPIYDFLPSSVFTDCVGIAQ